MAGLFSRRTRTASSGVQLFDAPARVPSSRATAIALTVATGALLVVTVPLYFVFLLNNIGDVFVMMANLRAASARRDAPNDEADPEDDPHDGADPDDDDPHDDVDSDG
ncbi:hypothetical protein [Subtercola endophyticus]|uniref:hypothetical protein n=1 Tax=Subtercola endophyticus TaxID=2895559 RepID=UPI001E44D107|nr:hypothetical protein [Subtercola endophyticus]UFS58859.1 hypothetical protein LQ955_17970 [Subtercola endophyticus]